MGPGATPPAGACNFEAQVAPQFEDSALMRMGWLARQPIPSTVYVMRIGVKINGRDWPGGSFCRYTRDTRANRGNTHMGKIVLYYTFENGLPTFVLIDSHHIKEQKGVMLVVDTVRSDQDYCRAY